MYPIDHIAILTSQLESMVLKLHLALQLEREDLGDISEQDDTNTREVYLGLPNLTHRVLVIEPTGPGPYHQALKKRGPGVHHIAVKTPDAVKLTTAFANTQWHLHLKSIETYKSCKTVFLLQKGYPLIEVIESKKTTAKKKTFLDTLSLPGRPKEWAPLKSDAFKTNRSSMTVLKRSSHRFSI